MRERVAIGIGCRNLCKQDELVALVRACLAEQALESAPVGLFTIAGKEPHAELAAAARSLGLPLAFLPRAALAEAAARALTRSEAALRALHLPSVAEAAALVGAGEGSALLAPRRKSASATCALAAAAEEA